MPASLLDLLYLFAGLVYLPFLCYQMLILGKNRHGWAERFARVHAVGSWKSSLDTRRLIGRGQRDSQLGR